MSKEGRMVDPEVDRRTLPSPMASSYRLTNWEMADKDLYARSIADTVRPSKTLNRQFQGEWTNLEEVSDFHPDLSNSKLLLGRRTRGDIVDPQTN